MLATCTQCVPIFYICFSMNEMSIEIKLKTPLIVYNWLACDMRP
jgi:hypothetical protein